MGEQPLIHWDWIARGLEDPIGTAVLQHLQLSLIPIALGLLAALPLGVAAARWRRLYPPVLTAVNVLYAVPSIALFFLLLPYTGLTVWTAVLPLALYTLAILVPNIVDGLHQVPDHVRQAATAMGFGPLRRLVRVELPVAVPAVIAGLRVASVATISMVSVASMVGLGGLGALILREGFNNRFATPIIVGVVLTAVLAFAVDALLVLAQRLLTPWAPRRRARPRRRETRRRETQRRETQRRETQEGGAA